jgi:hypothetical protein
MESLLRELALVIIPLHMFTLVCDKSGEQPSKNIRL